MNLPPISVIMPAYNCARYVAQSLESIFKQGYPHLEVLIVDDGSTDDTLAVVDRLGHPVRLVQQKNQGPAAARNRGLDLARGDYVAFLDADDVWLPGKLAAQSAHLAQHPKVDVVTTRFRRWHEDGAGAFTWPDVPALGAGPFPLNEEDSGWLYPDLLLDSRIHISTALVRRSLFDQVGRFDESLRTGEDYDFWLRASRCTAIHQLDVEAALYRIHWQSTTKVNWNKSNEYRVVRRAIERFGTAGPDGRSVNRPRLARRLAELCFQHAYLQYWHGDPSLAAAGFKATLSHSPFHLRAAAYVVLARLRSLRQPAKATIVE